MALEAKICGLTTPEAADAAVAGGAALVGFVFHAKSPRNLALDAAAALAARVPARVLRVGLIADADDARIAAILAAVPLDMLQLHGEETPQRIIAVKKRFGKPVMKAIAVAEAADLDHATAYVGVADWLMFDAKRPPSMAAAPPGGNALAFDWRLLAGRDWPMPWMLAGGLNVGNLAGAVRISGARRVDVSSGVEDRPGHKDPAKIAAFLALAAGL